jgi:integrase
VSVHRVQRDDGSVVWRVRWRDGGRGSAERSRTFTRKADATRFEDELRRRRRLGEIGLLLGSQETLDTYVTETWAPTHAVTLSPTTAKDYAVLYDKHIAPYLGQLKLIEITPETIARWQSDRLAAGAGRVSVIKALTVLGSILQRAFESERIARNPTRLVRKARRPPKREVRPLAPVTIEALRDASQPRDATLISVLAYAGLRPQEALALTWGHVRERTILVERAASLGELRDTKTRSHRTVRLLGPVVGDLAVWRGLSKPDLEAWIFPTFDGRLWTGEDWRNWRHRAWTRATAAVGLKGVRPYDLRHSFASLLLHEGRSVIYVARQLGHDAQLTLSTYGHVIDELDDAPRIAAEDAIMAARNGACVTGVEREVN